jgi:hypothetical protein
VQDEVIYRCVLASCARRLPRRVNFCPYCGSAQHAGVTKLAAPQDKPSFDKRAPGAVASLPDPAPAPEPRMPPVSSAPPAPPQAARAQAPARGAQPKPVRLRYFLLALAIPWLIWIAEKPNLKKIDARIDKAIAMASACRFGEAQSELTALKSARATPAQLQRLQEALDRALSACDRKRQRARPRADARAAAKPRADGAAQQAQSARNLIADAERDIAKGNYKAAIDKMEICAAMVDAGHRECGALSERAARLQQDMQRCLADGGNWSDGRCR